MNNDVQDRIEKLIADAADCDLIASSAADVRKRATFRRMAVKLRTMAAELQKELNEQ